MKYQLRVILCYVVQMIQMPFDCMMTKGKRVYIVLAQNVSVYLCKLSFLGNRLQ